LSPKSTTLFHRAYQAAIAIKGLDGGIETLAGLLVAIAGTERLYNFAIWITAPEIASNPDSKTAHLIRHGASGLMHASETFVVFYLLVHGILKLGIAINLLRESDWIFPPAVVILTGFVIFMSYKLTVHWSAWLLGFALFDTLTIALVLNEWRNHRARLAQQHSTAA
jgi:uncharacterized membrane protein